jgi:F-type H+-transporting ATPase subunit b
MLSTTSSLKARLWAAGAAIYTLAFLPAVASAADAGDQQGVIADLKQGKIAGGVAVVIFLIVFTILATKVWPTITKGLSDRENKIRDEIEAAEMARSQAKDALEQYQQALAQARAEAQKEIDKARAQAQAIAADLKAKNEADINAMRERAMKDLEAARRAAVAEVYAQGTQLATMMAGKILRREVTAGDQSALLEESLRAMNASRN